MNGVLDSRLNPFDERINIEKRAQYQILTETISPIFIETHKKEPIENVASGTGRTNPARNLMAK